MMESVILSSWDHIMGPQIQNLWYAVDGGSNKFVEVPCDVLKDFNMTKHQKTVVDSSPEKCMPDLQAYSIMCGQLLLGEVDSCKPCNEWASRFYLSESKILIAVVFHLNSWECSANEPKNDKNICLCFGTIFQRHALKFALDNQRIIDLHLRKAINTMQNSKIPFDLMIIKEITAVVENIASFLESLKAFNLNSIQPHEEPSFQECIQSDLMSKAIVSHLQTSGCSVVIGASDFLINQIIYGLSLFSSLKESCCSVVPHETSSSYIRGIYIQGAIKSMHIDSKYLSERASKESFSLTIVDVDLCKVWQSISVKDSTDTFRNTLSLVMETGQKVTQLVKDLAFIQKNEGDCKRFVQNFYGYLMVEAASLIKAIEPFRNSHNILTEKEIMAMFATYDIVDLKILLGCAEKLKPGFRSLVV